jgi:ferredoxin
MIETLLQAVADKLRKTDPPTLAPSVLDYQAQSLRDQMAQESFEQAKTRFPPKRILKERCTQCGICVENCPVEAIHLTDAPEIGPVCIHCLNCVRLCPEKAIVADLQPVYERLRERAVKLKEHPCTQIFV